MPFGYQSHVPLILLQDARKVRIQTERPNSGEQLSTQRLSLCVQAITAAESQSGTGGEMKTAQPVEAPVLPMGVMPTAKPAEASGPNYLPLNLYYPGLKKVFDSPPIYIVENFLTMEECEAFKVTASPLLQRSKTHAIAGLTPRENGENTVHTHATSQHYSSAPCVHRARAGSEATKGRTSLTCHLAKKAHPSPILLQKIQALTNKPFGHMELPQVARYTDSQRYVEHYDGVDPHTDAGRAFCSNGGQRVATVLCYLNDVADGGSTAFRRVNFEVKPKKGNALIFFPGFMNGELDTDALHAGMPAVDTKWVSQVWIRQYFREDGQPSSPVRLPAPETPSRPRGGGMCQPPTVPHFLRRCRTRRGRSSAHCTKASIVATAWPAMTYSRRS